MRVHTGTASIQPGLTGYCDRWNATCVTTVPTTRPRNACNETRRLASTVVVNAHSAKGHGERRNSDQRRRQLAVHGAEVGTGERRNAGGEHGRRSTCVARAQEKDR